VGRPREHDDATREALRAAAERLFDEHGPGGVSVRAVADAVGTTTRAVYSLFGSRDGLLVDALGERAFDLLGQWVDEHPETDDPAGDLIEMSVAVFRRFVREHPSLYRVTFQRAVPSFEPGPELLAARDRVFPKLVAKVARLEPAGQLGDRSVLDAVLAFQALCEGFGNFELRPQSMAILPAGREEASWRVAFTTLVRGFAPAGHGTRRRARS
jgi:AcrR family transcriptional regulator